MKRKILIPLLFAQFALGAQAQTKMILQQKSGGDIEIMLNEKPKAVYEGSELVIQTTGMTIRYQLSQLERIVYSEVTTSVDDSIISHGDGRTLVYDMNGRLIKTVPENQCLDMASLSNGIYIIKNNKNTYKIQKK